MGRVPRKDIFSILLIVTAVGVLYLLFVIIINIKTSPPKTIPETTSKEIIKKTLTPIVSTTPKPKVTKKPKVERIVPVVDKKAVSYIQKTKYIYRNIQATYSELSTTYSFTYEFPNFIGWETRRDPDNSIATLITMKFSVLGVPSEILNAPSYEVSDYIKRKLSEAVPNLRITWRVNDLIGLQITPYNFYAKDAIDSYTGLIDGIYKLAK